MGRSVELLTFADLVCIQSLGDHVNAVVTVLECSIHAGLMAPQSINLIPCAMAAYRYPGLAPSLLGLFAALVASPAFADSVQARCDVFPVGEDRAKSSGLCTFSQRQGFVSIRLQGGKTIELTPNQSTPDAFFDQRGEPAKREILEGNRGQVYRLEKKSIFVFWDPAPYAKR